MSKDKKKKKAEKRKEPTVSIIDIRDELIADFGDHFAGAIDGVRALLKERIKAIAKRQDLGVQVQARLYQDVIGDVMERALDDMRSVPVTFTISMKIDATSTDDLKKTIDGLEGKFLEVDSFREADVSAAHPEVKFDTF